MLLLTKSLIASAAGMITRASPKKSLPALTTDLETSSYGPYTRETSRCDDYHNPKTSLQRLIGALEVGRNEKKVYKNSRTHIFLSVFL